MLTILSLVKSQAISQTYKDSVTSIPNSKLRKAINLIEEGKVTKEELKLSKETINFLEHRIELKDSIIYKYAVKDLYWKQVDSNNKLEIVNYKKVITNTNQMYDIQTKNYKRQKKLGFVKLAFGVLIGLFIAK
jgi:DNA-binding XRE family transcriptional regulator